MNPQNILYRDWDSPLYTLINIVQTLITICPQLWASTLSHTKTEFRERNR